MPGPADHGEGTAELLAGGADLDAHVRLPDRVPRVSAVPVHLAEGRHRLAERGEGGQRICGGRAGHAGTAGGSGNAGTCGHAVFDHVLPPALGVVVPRGLGQHPDRVDGNGPELVVPLRALSLPAVPLPLLRHGQGVRRGQVDEADRDALRQRPADRDPFG